MPLESLGKVKNNDIHPYHRKNCSFNMLPHWLKLVVQNSCVHMMNIFVLSTINSWIDLVAKGTSGSFPLFAHVCFGP